MIYGFWLIDSKICSLIKFVLLQNEKVAEVNFIRFTNGRKHQNLSLANFEIVLNKL